MCSSETNGAVASYNPITFFFFRHIAIDLNFLQNQPFEGSRKRVLYTDLLWEPEAAPKKVVVFCHGYNGFKDWGPWHAVGQYFAQRGFLFVKFNFSHNGVTPEDFTAFGDLEAFAENNLTTELDDLGCLFDSLETFEVDGTPTLDRELCLIGHSRGGAIATLRAGEDDRVKRLCTWAGVSNYEDRFLLGNALVKWKEEGVYYLRNGRTGQQMPHNFQYYLDFRNNQERLDIKEACYRLTCPHLVFHGASDEAVHLTEAMRLHKWSRGSELVILDDTGHTFGGRHPWHADTLPEALKEVCQRTSDFFYKRKAR